MMIGVDMTFCFALLFNNKVFARFGRNSNNIIKNDKKSSYDKNNKNNKMKKNKIINRFKCWSCGLYQGDSELCSHCEFCPPRELSEL